MEVDFFNNWRLFLIQWIKLSLLKDGKFAFLGKFLQVKYYFINIFFKTYIKNITIFQKSSECVPTKILYWANFKHSSIARTLQSISNQIFKFKQRWTKLMCPRKSIKIANEFSINVYLARLHYYCLKWYLNFPSKKKI